MSDYSLSAEVFHIIIRGDIMVKSIFKSEDEKIRKELFNQKWKEYIEQAENQEPIADKGDFNAG